MATMLLVPPHPPLSSPNSLFSLHPLLRLSPLRTTTTRTVRPLSVSSASSSSSALQALIFDCDGVILESEHLHRQAYNDAFAHFNVRCPTSPSSSSQPLNWDSHFYDDLQNRIGGGKPKMRWYFKEHGWPSSTISETPPEDDADRAMLIDTLQDWKTERYKEIIRSGTVEPRPGVLRLMDEAKDAVLKKKKKEREVKGRIAIIGNEYVEDERVSKPDGEILKNRTYRENLPPPPPPPKQGHPDSKENQGPEVSRAEDGNIFVGEILLPAL